MGEDWDASAQAWIDFVETNVSRTHLLDKVMLDVAGEVGGSTVCDIGCGEGRFCRMLAKRGAKVYGLDPTLALLGHANRMDEGPRYTRARGESLPLADQQFDLVISYVTLIDIPDYRTAIREMARILRPGGRLLIANLNSFVTTSPQAWRLDEEGRQLYVTVDNYLQERPVQVSWCGIDVVNWHRPLTAYFEALLNTGLILKRYLEPRPSPRDMQEQSKLEGSDRVPFFHVMLWENPI